MSEYKIIIKEIPDEDGGGFEASIPELGEDAFVGSGETKEEAVKNLNALKNKLFKDYREKGIKIPPPNQEAEANEL